MHDFYFLSLLLFPQSGLLFLFLSITFCSYLGKRYSTALRELVNALPGFSIIYYILYIIYMYYILPREASVSVSVSVAVLS